MLNRRLFLTALFLLLAAGGLLTVRAQEGRLQVVASYSVLADVVSRVAGDAADVTALIPLGADPHAFEPTPQDLARLADADVVFVNGANFEGGLIEVVENAAADMNVVPASLCVPILPFGETDHEHEAEGETHEHEGEVALPEGEAAEMCAAHYAEMDAIHAARHEHAAEDQAVGETHDHVHGVEPLGPLYALDCGRHEHEGEAESGAHVHEHGSCDPHVWMEPHNVMYWTMLIRDTLAELDPANAQTYRANADTYLHELDALVHDEIMPLVESLPVERRVLVTDHELFGYFANRFGFEIVGVVIPGGSTVAEPSAAEVAALIETIRGEGVPAIFVNATVNPELTEQIAQEAGVTVETIYTHSVTGPDGPAPTYLDMMRYNVQVIVTALSR